MRPLLVGGCVRDAVLAPGSAPKDLDVEVYGGSLDDIAAAVAPIGKVSLVGRAFGVATMTTRDGVSLDLSVPRRDSRVGTGHRGFSVEVDPDMDPVAAASRRDFTINAMALDPSTGELIDPYGGSDDLRRRVLRHVSPAFADDPLRVLRGVQFASRFEMEMHPGTVELCRDLAARAGELPDERVRGEWQKWASAPGSPSSGWRVLVDTGWLGTLPGMSRAPEPQWSALQRGRVDDPTVLVTALLARSVPGGAREAFVARVLGGSDRQRLASAVATDVRPLPQTPADARAQARTGPPLRYRLAAAGADARAWQVADGVLDGPEPTFVRGADILAAGLPPGREVGRLIEESAAAQARGDFRDRAGALAWLAARVPRT